MSLEIKELLRNVIQQHGWSQKEVALRLHVSQSTISRILRRDNFQRYSSAAKSIHEGITALLLHRDAAPIPESVDVAIRGIWDGSDVQADALANVILSLQRLMAAHSHEKNGRSREPKSEA